MPRIICDRYERLNAKTDCERYFEGSGGKVEIARQATPFGWVANKNEFGLVVAVCPKCAGREAAVYLITDAASNGLGGFGEHLFTASSLKAAYRYAASYSAAYEPGTGFTLNDPGRDHYVICDLYELQEISPGPGSLKRGRTYQFNGKFYRKTENPALTNVLISAPAAIDGLR